MKVENLVEHWKNSYQTAIKDLSLRSETENGRVREKDTAIDTDIIMCILLQK
jgi:hypothetical protein